MKSDTCNRCGKVKEITRPNSRLCRACDHKVFHIPKVVVIDGDQAFKWAGWGNDLNVVTCEIGDPQAITFTTVPEAETWIRRITSRYEWLKGRLSIVPSGPPKVYPPRRIKP